MKGVNPETTTVAGPDLAAIRTRTSARSPEERIARQARLDAHAVGLAAMALGEEYLSRGELNIARGWFEIASTHDALDARSRLATIAVLTDAMNDPELVQTAEGTDLADADADLLSDRESAVEQILAVADVVRNAHQRAEQILAAARQRAEAIVANAHAEAASVAVPIDRPSEVMWTPGRIDVCSRSRLLIEVKPSAATDLVLPVRRSSLFLDHLESTRNSACSHWTTLLRDWVERERDSHRIRDEAVIASHRRPSNAEQLYEAQQNALRHLGWIGVAMFSSVSADRLMWTADRLADVRTDAESQASDGQAPANTIAEENESVLRAPATVEQIVATAVPQHRTLLGVDVIGSAQLPGYLQSAVSGTISKLVSAALAQSGIGPDDVLSHESQGDGALVVLPSGQLGAALDAAVLLDQLTTDHNRWHKPEMRLRIAVHLGQVTDDGGFDRARIAHARLLDAPEFKDLLKRCHEEGEDTANTALIVSSEALEATFSGDSTRVVRRGDFASISVTHKQYRHNAWVRVPGFDPRSLVRFAEPAPAPESVVRPQNVVHGDMQPVVDDGVNSYKGCPL